MKIKDITSYLESVAPLAYQESYDNSGLIVGNPDDEVNKVLISLDCTEEVVDEAIRKGCNLIISHHPIVFKGLKRFNNRTYVERTVIKAIKNDIALYAIHTNLDNVLGGVNTKIAEKLGLLNAAILSPKSGIMKKLTVYVPRANVEDVRQALFEAGAGSIGDYDQCSYNTAGYGTFRPLAGANPAIGEVGTQERVEETKIEVVFPQHIERKVVVSMLAAHPYPPVSTAATAEFEEALGLDEASQAGGVLELPDSMTARRDGEPAACVNGTVVQRVEGGWEQVLEHDAPVACVTVHR